MSLRQREAVKPHEPVVGYLHRIYAAIKARRPAVKQEEVRRALRCIQDEVQQRRAQLGKRVTLRALVDAAVAQLDGRPPDECLVCMERQGADALLYCPQCDKPFCLKCLSKWHGVKATCPHCTKHWVATPDFPPLA